MVLIPLSFFLLLRSGRVEAVCAAGEFECCDTTVCIPVSAVNNTIKDCQDNSDEAGSCCPKTSDFHCGEGPCVHISYWQDGKPDCDKNNPLTSSDELKYIGVDCTQSLQPGKCCQCASYIPNSECRDDGSGLTCQCVPGYYAAVSRLLCLKRVFGDPCFTHSDCSFAIPDTICRSPNMTCDCQDGWAISGGTCVNQSQMDLNTTGTNNTDVVDVVASTRDFPLYTTTSTDLSCTSGTDVNTTLPWVLVGVSSGAFVISVIVIIWISLKYVKKSEKTEVQICNEAKASAICDDLESSGTQIPHCRRTEYGNIAIPDIDMTTDTYLTMETYEYDTVPSDNESPTNPYEAVMDERIPPNFNDNL